MSSILSNYQRSPKIYIKLPSNGHYYKDNIDLSMNNRLAIRAMTAKDELLLKNPDALMNGDAIIKIIESCVPEIKINPKELISPDVDTIILAIIHSSYGDNLEFQCKCPVCSHDNLFGASIESLLETVSILEPPFIIKEVVNDKEMTFHLKPHTYGTITKQSLKEFENNKMIQYISSPDMSDEDKLKKFNECFNKMAEYNFEIVADSIEKIVVEEGEVTDRNEINSFINEAEGKLINKINKLAKEINNSGIDNNFGAICQNKECNHEWKTKIEFDPSRFFGLGFNR